MNTKARRLEKNMAAMRVLANATNSFGGNGAVGGYTQSFI